MQPHKYLALSAVCPFNAAVFICFSYFQAPVLPPYENERNIKLLYNCLSFIASIALGVFTAPRERHVKAMHYLIGRTANGYKTYNSGTNCYTALYFNQRVATQGN